MRDQYLKSGEKSGVSERLICRILLYATILQHIFSSLLLHHFL